MSASSIASISARTSSRDVALAGVLFSLTGAMQPHAAGTRRYIDVHSCDDDHRPHRGRAAPAHRARRARAGGPSGGREAGRGARREPHPGARGAAAAGPRGAGRDRPRALDAGQCGARRRRAADLPALCGAARHGRGAGARAHHARRHRRAARDQRRARGRDRAPGRRSRPGRRRALPRPDRGDRRQPASHARPAAAALTGPTPRVDALLRRCAGARVASSARADHRRARGRRRRRRRAPDQGEHAAVTAPAFTPTEVARLRDDTPGCAHVAHLNNAGASLMPSPVLAALHSHLDAEATMGGYEAEAAAAERLDAAHTAIAELVGGAPEEVALTENQTRAWDMAFYGVDLRPGDRILTTHAEYSSQYYALLDRARRTGARVEVLADDEHGQLSLDALEQALDDRVRVVSIVHAPTFGGLVNPVAEA